MTENNYKTDRYGRPDSPDYHYRIPLNDNQAVKRASLALKGMYPYKGRIVYKWDGFSGDQISYLGIRTNDSKGHLTGLAKYAHSPKWRDLGVMSDINEYRYYKKGTKVRGTFNVDPMSFNGVSRLQFETVLDVTPSELETAYENMGDTWGEIQRSLQWAKEDAMESAREQIAERQRNCEHEHAVFPDNHIGETARSDGYCETCGAELQHTDNGDIELAY